MLLEVQVYWVGEGILYLTAHNGNKGMCKRKKKGFRVREERTRASLGFTPNERDFETNSQQQGSDAGTPFSMSFLKLPWD